MKHPVPEPQSVQEYQPKAQDNASRFNLTTGSQLPSFDELCQARSYDERLAYALSVIAAWSYSDGQTLANKLVWYGMPDNTVQAFSVVNSALLVEAKAFLILSKTRKSGVLSFAGTEPNSPIDLLTDANVMYRRSRDPAPGEPEHALGQVHCGFYDSVQVLWGDLANALQEACNQGLESLFVTGHSLGGAMAVLAAVRISELSGGSRLLRAVYTYGQPAVGNGRFAEEAQLRIGKTYYRHRFGHDVVPLLPPRECDDFTHFGSALSYVPAKRAFVAERNGTARNQAWLVPSALGAVLSALSRRVPYTSFGRLTKNLPLYSIDDHGPGNYVEACRSAYHRALMLNKQPREPSRIANQSSVAAE